MRTNKSVAIALMLAGACASERNDVDDDLVIHANEKVSAASFKTIALERVESSDSSSEFRELDGLTLYQGLIFGDGPVVEMLPSVRDHGSLEATTRDPELLRQSRVLLQEIMAQIEREEPGYFDVFGAEVLSRDHGRVVRAILGGQQRAHRIFEAKKSLGAAGSEDKCVVAVVAVAVLATHVFAVGNHVLYQNSAWVEAHVNGGDVDIDGDQTQALMTSQNADDATTMVTVPVWEFLDDQADGTYRGATVYTSRTTHQLFVGDFDGDGISDRLYFSPDDPDGTSLFTHYYEWNVPAWAGSHPVIGDFDGNGKDDILWTRHGAPQQIITFFSTTLIDGIPFIVLEQGTYGDTLPEHRPLVGNFNNVAGDDILWYYTGGDGSQPENMWMFRADRSFVKTANDIQIQGEGRYVPLAGDFFKDNSDDIVWYCPGTCPDKVWEFKQAAATSIVVNTSWTMDVDGTYNLPFVGDFDANGRDDIFWYNRGTGADSIWFHDGDDGRHATHGVTVNGTYDPVVADFKTPEGGSRYPTIIWWPNR